MNRLQFVLAFLVGLSFHPGTSSPLLIQCTPGTLCASTEQPTTLEISERNEQDTTGDGSGSGDDTSYPCGDDEDSPCHGISPAISYPEPRIRSLQVETLITARYVSTTVITEIENKASVSQDSDFRFRLSKEAFISDFFMVIKGKVYQAEVRKKEDAQKAYNEAKRQSLSAAQVKQSDNDPSKFETNVNLSPNTTATFHLSFQELLRRDNGVFQHRINLFPKEIVKRLRADVYITEPQGISFANITWEQDDSLTTDFLYDALSVKRQSDTRLHAMFAPSHEDQEGLSKTGLQGDLVVTYDVVHDSGAGHIEVVNGYFVHHISPEGLPVTPKNVIFVIDFSGSMQGSKIAQTKVAMETIINDIREFDHFNIVCFSNYIVYWRNAAVEGTPENKISATTFVNELQAVGGTDIHQGLMEAVNRLKELEEQNVRDALSMIILLTDGEPTSGVTSPGAIITSVTEAIDGQIALFSLAFGESADYELLQQLSGHNQGLARKIYSDSSPSLQLSGFYKEVATPILHNINVQYLDDAVDMETVTKTSFLSYFEGTELVIAGKIKEDYQGDVLSCYVAGNSFDVHLEWELTKSIETHSDEGDFVLKPHQVDDFAERMWAYVTIKDLLAQIDIALTTDEKNLLKEKATNIALKYKFVTPLTSLIVIKPEDDSNFDDIVAADSVDTEDESYSNDGYPIGSASHSVLQYQNAPSVGSSTNYQLLVLGSSEDDSNFDDIVAADSVDTEDESYSNDGYPIGSASHSVLQYQNAPSVGSSTNYQLLVLGSPAPVTTRLHIVPLRIPLLSADGDPHAFVSIPHQNVSVCFEIAGEDGMIINLLRDDELGININAAIRSLSPAEDVTKSFFSTFGLTLGNHAIVVTPRNIITESGITLDWKTKSGMAFGDFVISVSPDENILVITHVKGVLMFVKRHSDLRQKKSKNQRHYHQEHLGLYFGETSGFSTGLSGIFGQFFSVTQNVYVEPGCPSENNQECEETTILRLNDVRIPVVWHERNHRSCWHAGNSGIGNLNPRLFLTESLF